MKMASVVATTRVARAIRRADISSSKSPCAYGGQSPHKHFEGTPWERRGTSAERRGWAQAHAAHTESRATRSPEACVPRSGCTGQAGDDEVPQHVHPNSTQGGSGDLGE